MAMHDSSQDTQSQNGYALIIIAGGLSALLLSIILFIFASNVESRELYHGYYLLASFIFTAGFGVSMGFKRFGLAAASFVVLALILTASIMKFNARADINMTIRDINTPTILGAYVLNVPVWEQRVLPFFKTPKWVEFDKECFRPSFTEGASFSANCASKEVIFTHYNINVMSLINGQYSKQYNTAKRIRNQEFANKAAYEGCLSDGYCAQVPLLPSAVLPDSIGETSPEYKEIRQAFWQIIDHEKMQVEYCESIDLCRAMTLTGAVDRRDFQSNS